MLFISGCNVEKHIDEISRGVDMKQIELIRGVDKKHKIRFSWVLLIQNHAIIPMSKCLRSEEHST